MIAQGVADVRALPPGPYIVRAKVTSGAEALGDVRRAFTVIEAPRGVVNAAAASIDTTVRTTPARPSARGTLPAFALDDVLAPHVVGAFLDRVAARPDASAPAMRRLLERARTGPLGELEVADNVAATAPVAAFLKGLSLLAQKKLEPAAVAFKTALNTSGGDLFPAMVYIGACYAAGGKDKEAAAAWRTAMIKEADAPALHLLLTDALLRQDQGEQALQALVGARTRWPNDERLDQRFAVAALLAGRYAEGLDAVDQLLAKGLDDEPSLALALHALYEASVKGDPIQQPDQDRARMLKYAEAYRAQNGQSLALVEVWVAAATQKR
jgi:hypothetical protein